MKEPLMKSFLSQVVACDYTENKLFPSTPKVFQNSYFRYSVEQWWTAIPEIAYKNEKGHV